MEKVCIILKEYYSALEKEIVTSARTWIDLENIILNELSWTQKKIPM